MLAYQIRNFIYVDELAEACVRALSNKCKNKILTIAGKEKIDIIALSQLIKNQIKGKVTIKIETKSNRKSDYTGEIDNLKQSYELLNWEPTINIKSGIKKYIDWYKNELAD